MLEIIKRLTSSDWIALAAALVAGVSLLVSWRSASYQRMIDNDRELLRQIILTLERAYVSIGEESPSFPPRQSRLGWLTAARHIAAFKTLRAELQTPLHKTLCEEHEEYWRHRFYVMLSRIGSHTYFEWNSPESRQLENIDPTSAAVIFAFSNWPKERKDPLAAFSLKQLIEENDLFSTKFRHFRTYIETRFPRWRESGRVES
jgi:hypothetical protein